VAAAESRSGKIATFTSLAVPRLGQITWRADQKKIEGPLGKKMEIEK